jgi:hypothetical protein
MAEQHESLIIAFRKRILKKGFREGKSPMPTFRPDVFAERISTNGRIIEQIAVEAEIASSLFSEHTTGQLVKLSEFIEHQKGKGIPVRGYLLVPGGKRLLAQANSLLFTLPASVPIRVVQLP